MRKPVMVITTRRALALRPGLVTYLPGSGDKSMAGHFAADAKSEQVVDWTDYEIFEIERLAWVYRRQIAPDLIPSTEPPKKRGNLVIEGAASRVRP